MCSRPLGGDNPQLINLLKMLINARVRNANVPGRLDDEKSNYFQYWGLFFIFYGEK